MATLTDQFNVSYSPGNWGGAITTGTALWTPGAVAAPPSPDEQTPMEWLEDRVAEVCKRGRL